MKTISYYSFNAPTPWSVFDKTGEQRQEFRGHDVPVDAWIPTGEHLNYFATLADAQEAYPDAILEDTASEAKQAGIQ